MSVFVSVFKCFGFVVVIVVVLLTDFGKKVIILAS